MFSFVEIIAFLGAAIIIAVISKKSGISNILLFLLAGVFLGPECLCIIKNVEITEIIGNVGVIFLLFSVGLHLPIDRLKVLKKYVFIIGALQVLLTTIAYFLLMSLLNNDIPLIVNLVVSFAVSLSSTAIVVEILNKDDDLGTKHGKSSFGVLLFQDFAVIVAFALLPLAYPKANADILTAVFSLVKAFIVVVVLVILCRYSFRHVFKIAAESGSEIFISVILIVVFGTAYITNLVGMSMELGAFLAGLLLAGSEYRLQIEAEIDPFKGLLLGLFFLSVGMSINVMYLNLHFREIINIVAMIVLVKFAAMFFISILNKNDVSSAIRSACVIAGGGEFAFVLFAPSVEHKLITESMKNIYSIAISISMALIPIMSIIGNWVAMIIDKRQMKKIAPETIENKSSDVSDHVIIAGFGRVGQTIASLLSQHFIPFIAIDENMNKVSKARAKGLPVFYGDAKRREIFRMLGVQNAKMVIVTLGRPDNTVKAVSMLLRNFPNIDVWLRLNDSKEVERLEKLGAKVVVPQIFEASLQLGESVLFNLGITSEDAKQTVEKIRGSLNSNVV